MQPSAATKLVFRCQVSGVRFQISGFRRAVAAMAAQAGFRIWGLLTPDT